MNIPFAPERASTQAETFDALFLAMTAFSAGIVLLVGTLILAFSVRFRANSESRREGVRILHARRLEITWTALTAFFALFFFWYASSASLDAVDIPEDAMEFHVEAKQWMWKAKHPSGVRELNALHLPTGRPIVVYLNSQDVIHSFFIPEFRIKQDVVPGRTSLVWFEATVPGTYRLLCTEYCGTDHAMMIGEVVAMAPADYARWLETRPEGDTLVAEGRALFVSAGCSGCHAEGSRVHAPRLAGTAGRAVPLRDGRVVVADAAYLRDSILLPRRDIAAGYEPIMPQFGSILSDGEVEALVAYIQSLATEEEPS